MQEQSAHFRRTFEIGRQRQQLVAEGLPKLRAGLRVRAEVVGIEGLLDADLPEHLAGAADLPRLRVLQHKHIEVAVLAIVRARKAGLRLRKLRDERCALRREVREPAAGQLRHLVDGGEIVGTGRPDAEAHDSSAKRRIVSADKAARSARLSTIRNSSMLWILPPRTPIVSTTGTPQAAMLLPSQTPPDGCQAMDWPRSCPVCLTRLNKASASSVSGLGGRAKPPCASMKTSCCFAVSSSALAIRRAAISWSSLVLGRMLTRRMARSGTTLFGLPPSILAGLIDSPGVFDMDRRSASSDAATIAFRPSSGLRPAWALRPRTTNEKLPLPGRAPASVPSGSAAGS